MPRESLATHAPFGYFLAKKLAILSDLCLFLFFVLYKSRTYKLALTMSRWCSNQLSYAPNAGRIITETPCACRVGMAFFRRKSSQRPAADHLVVRANHIQVGLNQHEFPDRPDHRRAR